MKKEYLLTAVSAKSKVSSAVANKVIKSLVKTIAESVENGEKITLTGLGTFRAKTRKAKQARNLQTGEAVHIPEGRKISFKPSLSFRRVLKKREPFMSKTS